MNFIFQVIFDWLSSFFGLLKPGPDRAWWVRIKTENPEYTYYFGPFENRAIARSKQPGFIEDLRTENAVVSHCTVERCAPPQPTIPGHHQPV